MIVTNKSVLGHRCLPGLEQSSCLCLPTPASASRDPSAGTPGQGEEASPASQGGRRGQPLLALAGPPLGRFVQTARLHSTSTSARDQSNAYPRSVTTRGVATGCGAEEDLAGRGPAAQPRSSGRRNPQDPSQHKQASSLVHPVAGDTQRCSDRPEADFKTKAETVWVGKGRSSADGPQVQCPAPSQAPRPRLCTPPKRAWPHTPIATSHEPVPRGQPLGLLCTKWEKDAVSPRDISHLSEAGQSAVLMRVTCVLTAPLRQGPCPQAAYSLMA